jgi:hypothetical protein
MNPADMLRRAKNFIRLEGGTIAPLPISEEELNPDTQDDLSVRVTPLEDMSDCYPVPYDAEADSATSEFAYFEDGRQRTVQVGFIPVHVGTHLAMVPVHFYVVAAVILRRDGRDLQVWGSPELQSGIMIDRSLVPNQEELDRFTRDGLEIVNIDGEGGDYYDLRRRALQEAKNRRLNVEDALITRWGESSESASNFLVVDGTLMNLRSGDTLERCVGVSKSFGSRYFDVSSYNRVLSMPEFSRSWSFRFHSDEEGDDPRLGGRDRVSWYLRLRLRPNVDPEFGLIRVEVSHHHASSAAECAERFSRSLISERLPTAYPNPRWDKHLYPIATCEEYLSSIMPSIATINAAMKG